MRTEFDKIDLMDLDFHWNITDVAISLDNYKRDNLDKKEKLKIRQFGGLFEAEAEEYFNNKDNKINWPGTPAIIFYKALVRDRETLKFDEKYQEEFRKTDRTMLQMLLFGRELMKFDLLSEERRIELLQFCNDFSREASINWNEFYGNGRRYMVA